MISFVNWPIIYTGRCTEDVPISSALEEDRQSRANIAASFQVVHGG